MIGSQRLSRMLRRLLLLASLIFLSFGLTASAGAQIAPSSSLQAKWTESANRAIAAIERPPAANDAEGIARLEALRSQLASDRDTAFRYGERGNLNEKIILAQIESLGPEPAEGAAEPASIARRRTMLAERLAEAQAPTIAAKNAYIRAQVLIRELDRIVTRTKKQEAYLRLPSPLLPGTWIGMFRHPWSTPTAPRVPSVVGQELAAQSLSARILLALGLLAVGILIGILAQRGLIRAIDRWLGAAGSKGTAILLIIARDIASVILPLAGFACLLGAVLIAAAHSPNIVIFVTSTIVAGLFFTLSFWLGHSLFAPSLPRHRFIRLSDGGARRAFWATVAIGAILSVESLAEQADKAFGMSDATTSITAFGVIAMAAAGLWVLANILLHDPDRQTEPHLPASSAKSDQRIDLVSIAAKLLKLAAVVIVVLGATGYIALARNILVPTLLTMALASIAVLTFHRTMQIADAFFGAFGAAHHHATQLLPVLFGLLLILLTLPVAAMFWGVRLAEIGDFISALRNGVAVGDVRISIGEVVTFALIFAIGYAITRWIQRLVLISVMPRVSMDRGAQQATITAIGYVGLTLSALVAITSAGLDLSSLAIVAGALSVGVGFGLQSVVANFISGLILLVERPIKEGDWIEVAGYSGIVAKISVRSTRLKTFERDDVIIPNSEFITGTVRNRTLSGSMGRIDVSVGVAYGSDIRRASDVLLDIAKSIPAVVASPAPIVLLEELGDSALALKLLCFVDNIESGLTVKSEIRSTIHERFAEAGIAIPFPQREITIKYAANSSEEGPADTARADI